MRNIISLQEINEEIENTKAEIKTLEADIAIIKKYSFSSRAGFNLIIELRERIEELQAHIDSVEAYKAKHHQ
tara:strand:+ start:233 stop:448 length:216 start_codon:yes stop_codon:yes gene_type:complete